MSHIITITREFGSGGREVGKRLADILDLPYYDNEILTKIAEESGLSREYIEKYSAKITHSYPISVGRTFITPSVTTLSDQIFTTQAKIIKELASEGPCIIVGRCGDFFLKELNPLSINIHASIQARLRRCFEKGEDDLHLSEKEMRSKILGVDKARKKYYEYYTGQKWHAAENYSVSISTSKFGVKETANILAKLYEVSQ